ncbi:hypothetical protein PR048_000852 [Dryococelus australis]|uniref:Integrase catalytic domain-containing protein n=1 Tax=Dryococelus australis TaxID=614101 RepID=A0ABQ9IFV5_9NEOP|nr:hypothetical protein PR048_000852 [Dryococelus australis]
MEVTDQTKMTIFPRNMNPCTLLGLPMQTGEDGVKMPLPSRDLPPAPGGKKQLHITYKQEHSPRTDDLVQDDAESEGILLPITSWEPVREVSLQLISDGDDNDTNTVHKLYWVVVDAHSAGNTGTVAQAELFSDGVCWIEIDKVQQQKHQPRLSTNPFETVPLDLMGPYPRSSRGERVIVVVTDNFSRWVKAYPVSSAQATSIAKILQTDFFPGMWRKLRTHLSVQHTKTTIYHPCANPTECHNQQIKNQLQLRVGKSPINVLLGHNLTLPGEFNCPKAADDGDPADTYAQCERHEEAHKEVFTQQRGCITRWLPTTTSPTIWTTSVSLCAPTVSRDFCMGFAAKWSRPHVPRWPMTVTSMARSAIQPPPPKEQLQGPASQTTLGVQAPTRDCRSGSPIITDNAVPPGIAVPTPMQLQACNMACVRHDAWCRSTHPLTLSATGNNSGPPAALLTASGWLPEMSTAGEGVMHWSSAIQERCCQLRGHHLINPPFSLPDRVATRSSGVGEAVTTAAGAVMAAARQSARPPLLLMMERSASTGVPDLRLPLRQLMMCILQTISGEGRLTQDSVPPLRQFSMPHIHHLNCTLTHTTITHTHPGRRCVIANPSEEFISIQKFTEGLCTSELTACSTLKFPSITIDIVCRRCSSLVGIRSYTNGSGDLYMTQTERMVGAQVKQQWAASRAGHTDRSPTSSTLATIRCAVTIAVALTEHCAKDKNIGNGCQQHLLSMIGKALVLPNTLQVS